MKRILLVLVLSLLPAAAALAQVRNPPAGNSLPEQAIPDANAARIDVPSDEGAEKVITRQQHDAFARRVDTSAFGRLAVFDEGRVKIMETLAQETLTRIYGKARWRDQSAPTDQQFNYDPVFTYLDLIFNKPYYFDKPIIYVEVLNLRRSLVSGMKPQDQELWLHRGRLTPYMMADPSVGRMIQGMNADLLIQRAIGQVRLSMVGFEEPESLLRMVSPGPGSQKWALVFDLTDTRTASAAPGGPLPQVSDPQAAQRVVEQFRQLAEAWGKADAVGVNLALASLAQAIPQVNPETYPTPFHRLAEHVYNATNKFTIGYVGYLLGAIVLLIAFGMHRRWLVRTGIALLLLGFTVHTLGILTRMLLSGRWPIDNQYESYIAISWLAVLVGMIMMFVSRRWIYGAAASAMGAAALLFANTVDIPSNEMSPVAGILATSRILYVHVHMVLASYGLISLGFFMSLFYLATYYWKSKSVTRFAAAGLGEVEVSTDAGDATGGGGAAGSGAAPTPGRQALLNDLDRAQMVVLQLAFWILGTGILLGAYWADHAWGRWWGWDPKETWALITWIIYLMVIHLRLVVKERGLVTAWMSVLGFGVMLWTYWGVNLLLAGLHSYA